MSHFSVPQLYQIKSCFLDCFPCISSLIVKHTDFCVHTGTLGRAAVCPSHSPNVVFLFYVSSSTDDGFALQHVCVFVLSHYLCLCFLPLRQTFALRFILHSFCNVCQSFRSLARGVFLTICFTSFCFNCCLNVKL